MKTIETLSEYEKRTGRKTRSPYYFDHHYHKYGTITIIWLGVSPTGRTSKHWHQSIVYKKGSRAELSNSEIIRQAVELTPEKWGYKLPKGYSWSNPLIQHNFLH